METFTILDVTSESLRDVSWVQIGQQKCMYSVYIMYNCIHIFVCFKCFLNEFYIMHAIIYIFMHGTLVTFTIRCYSVKAGRV